MPKRTTPPDLAEFDSDADELQARRDFMVRSGYRFCSILACDCNSWHGGHAQTRLEELHAMLYDHDAQENGEVLIDAVQRILREAGYTND